MNRAVFLDRDGVINRKAPEGDYITTWEDFQFLPYVAKAIALLNAAGLRVIVISNQRCVAKGLLTVESLESMHRRMSASLAASDAKLDAIYYCPHDTPSACNCRKPAPGMILAAASEHNINLKQSWMIGDTDSDVEAGRSAGCSTVRILEPKRSHDRAADILAQNLLDAVQQILALDSSLAGDTINHPGSRQR